MTKKTWWNLLKPAKGLTGRRKTKATPVTIDRMAEFKHPISGRVEREQRCTQDRRYPNRIAEQGCECAVCHKTKIWVDEHGKVQRKHQLYQPQQAIGDEMQEQVEKVLGDAIGQTLGSGPEPLIDLAMELAKFSLLNTVNLDGSNLRTAGLALSGAIMDWALELYPDHKP